MKPKNLVIWLASTAVLLVSCTAKKPESTPSSARLSNVTSPDSTPFPSTIPGLSPSPALTLSPRPSHEVIPSTTTAATIIKPGWTKYLSVNRVYDLAFAPDGTLWALTYGSLIHWDLDAETYTRYLFQVREIAVAPDGTLWLATDNGLCHFDGEACTNYTEADGLIHDAVRAVTVAADGTVWAGTQMGVSRFDGRSWTSYPSPVPTEDLAVAPNGEVWHATAVGVGRYSPSRDTWTTYTEDHGLPHSHANVVAVGSAGEVWTHILWYGLYRFENERWHVIAEAPGGNVAGIAFAADGTPWVATRGSMHYTGGVLAYRDGDAWVDVTTKHGLESVAGLALGREGAVAAATNQGLGVYRGGEWRLLKDGPTFDIATDVAVTDDGDVWFAFGAPSMTSGGGGVSRLSHDDQDWEYYLGDTKVYVLSVAADGSLWAAAANGVLRFDGRAWQMMAGCSEILGAGLVDCGFLDLAFTSDDGVWVANGSRVARSPGSGAHGVKGQSWIRYDMLVHSLEPGPDGSIWMNGWEGLQGSGYVARYSDSTTDGETWKMYKASESFVGPFAVGAVTHDGRVWGVVPDRGLVSTSDGASWTESASWAFYQPPDSVSVAALLDEAPDGALWLRTQDGIARFDPSVDPTASGESALDAWTVFTVDGGAVGHPGAIAFGPSDEIWLGTTRFQPDEADTP